jgi:hypothetical protein
MNTEDQKIDIHAIEALIGRQFGSLSWSPETPADWEGFMQDFFPEASLYPAARPVKRQSIPAFVKRLAGLSETQLTSFREDVLGTEVRVFGNVAVAVAGCQTIENESVETQGVEMLLLVKDEGRWQIVAQAWDTASGDVEMPHPLAVRGHA